MFCTTECWDCNDRTCEHYVDKTKLYFDGKDMSDDDIKDFKL